MKLKIKKLDEGAVIPSYAKAGDACFDLTAVSVSAANDYIEYGTGLAMEIPEGYVGLIFPRSSVTNKDLMLKNSVGVIDSGYRGEIKFRFNVVRQSIRNEATEAEYQTYFAENKITDEAEMQYVRERGLVRFSPNLYNVGERVGQMMIIPVPTVEFEEVGELTETVRGEGGYGSTGA
jgi:dUTP pyrophosphatase